MGQYYKQKGSQSVTFPNVPFPRTLSISKSSICCRDTTSHIQCGGVVKVGEGGGGLDTFTAVLLSTTSCSLAFGSSFPFLNSPEIFEIASTHSFLHNIIIICSTRSQSQAEYPSPVTYLSESDSVQNVLSMYVSHCSTLWGH